MFAATPDNPRSRRGFHVTHLLGTTPARAGRTSRSTLPATLVTGPPPLARGARVLGCWSIVIVRTTPARAGRTLVGLR